MNYKNSFIFSLALFLSLFYGTTTFGQYGVVEGILIDSETNEPIFGATVSIDSTTIGGVTDFDGKFKLSNIPEGTYQITSSYISYKPTTKKDVSVRAGNITQLEFALDRESYSLEEVTLVSEANREAESVLLLDQREAITAMQSIGARELSRKGVGDAQMAVSKVSGISKQEGVKNVFVRGLGDRYNATLLNGMPIPSEDPEYKNISLEFFGSDIIQNIRVSKVFSGSNGGDVAGAIIDITSKELIGSQAFEVEASLGVNSETTKVDFLSQDGTNYFGHSNNTKPIPGIFGFSNHLDPSVMDNPINHSYRLSGGKKLMLGANPFSFYVLATHATGFSYTKEIVRNTNTAGILYQDQTGAKHSRKTNQLVLANLNYKMDNKHSLTYNFMMLHANNQYVGEYAGKHSERHQDGVGDMGYLRRQQANDNTLLTHQLLSFWELNPKWNLRADFSLNDIKALEPDRRENYLSMKEDGSYGLTGSNRQKRFFSELNSQDYNTKMILEYQLNDRFETTNSKISIGYNGHFAENDFEAIEYNFSAPMGSFSIDTILLDDIYNPSNFDQGLFSMTQGTPNTYEVTKTIHSAFAEGTYQLTESFTGNIGLKVDQVDMQVAYDIPGRADKNNRLEKSYFLPSLNLKYAINQKNTLRLGTSKSYTLPQSKEISPYQYVNIGFASEGNPNLKPSDNYNVDIKWDNYLSRTELFSATAFYKHIVNPIGRVDQGNSAGLLTYNNIGESATVMGVEVELRKNIFSNELPTTSQERNLSFGLNASWIYTDVTLDLINTPKRNSELEGASPFLINSDLTYQIIDRKNRNLTSSLVFNYFSDRIYTIGALGYEDIIEEGVATLDFVSSYQLSKSIGLKLKATNLLDPSFTLTRESNHSSEKTILNQYKKGINVSLGVSLEL